MTATDEYRPRTLAPISECRPWCAYPGTHRVEDRGGCCGEEREQVLSLELTKDHQQEFGLPEEPLKLSVFAGAEGVGLEPYIEISRDGMTGERLTATEARLFAAHILVTCDEVEGVQR